MQRKMNMLLLLFSLIGGTIGFAIGEVILGKLSEGWPRFVVVGLYYGVLALCIGLSCLIAEMISPRLNGASWRQRYIDLSWKLLVPATLALLFVVGGLVQLIYGLQFGGLKPVKDIVLVIDNSGSMLETDPDNERFSAAKQLINNMESDNIYDKIDKQTLLTERTGTIADSTFYTLLRILSLVIIGAAIGVALGILFDNRFLAVSFGAGGIVGGLLAGFILDFGLSGHVLSDGLSRLAAVLVLAAIIALFTLVVPVGEKNGTKPRGGGRKGSLQDRPAAGLGGRTKDSRSHGF